MFHFIFTNCLYCTYYLLPWKSFTSAQMVISNVSCHMPDLKIKMMVLFYFGEYPSGSAFTL